MRFRYAVVGCFVALAASAAMKKPAEQPSRRKAPGLAPADMPDRWTVEYPRKQLAPEFEFEPKGGFDGAGAFKIAADNQEGLHGWFKNPFPVTGGKYYRFHAFRKAQGVAVPRRSVYARIVWSNSFEFPVPRVLPDGKGDPIPNAEPEYPRDSPTKWPGYVAVSGVYRALPNATRAWVELHLDDAPNGSVTWSDINFTECEPPKPRPVRLAAVHFTPKGGKEPIDNCKMYEPFVADAAEQKADLVVLGEAVNSVGLGMTYEQVAEGIDPKRGSTKYFADLAKKHHLYIVVGLVERDDVPTRFYNAAVLIDSKGEIVGKYRKVCLPRSETEGGITAGKGYPVFDTRSAASV